MEVVKRIINAMIFVGLVVTACFGIILAIGLIMNADNSPLFRVGIVLIFAGLFAQGYAIGGDNNSEAKSAD